MTIHTVDLQTIADDVLLDRYDAGCDELRAQQLNVGLLQQEIYRRLEECQARAIPSNEFICELIPQNSYNQAAFTPLREILVEADLKAVLEPAHEEVVWVKDKWAITKVLALARRLPEVHRIVEQARIEGRSKLKFEKR